MGQKGLSHIALKTRDLKKTEAFYTDVLGFKVAFRHPPNMLFLTTPGSDDLLNFVRSSQKASGNQGLEHIGFKVESVEAVKKDLAVLREANPEMRERVVSEPSEAERRVALIASCRHGQFQCSSPDGVFVDVSDG